MGSHPSLGEAGRLLLRKLLHWYEHVFPAPGEPVTIRTTSVQHEILTSDSRPVRCGPRNLSVDTEGILWHRRAPPSGASQLVVPGRERQDMIRRFHDSLFADHLASRTIYRLLDRVYWPGLRQNVPCYLASCAVCLARKSLCPRRASMGHVDVGHRWDRVAMDVLDMSVTTPKGNRYVLVMVDCVSRWTEACLLPDKTALAVADAFFQHIYNHAFNT